MTKQPRVILAVTLTMAALAQSGYVRGQIGSAATAHRATITKAAAPEMEEQIRELREMMLGQQAQIDALRQQLADRDAKLAIATLDAQSANLTATAATAQTASVNASLQANAVAVTALNSTMADLKGANTGLAQTLHETKKDLGERLDSPPAIRYKGVTITPVAFFALENVWRQRSVSSDVNTPFNNIPYMGANQAHISEFNFSGRQSQIGAQFQGDAGPFKLTGYVEADFLGAGTTSNGNQGNGFVLRQRQIWGQAAMANGFTVTGGQMWSLVTENGQGTDNNSEKFPNTVDAQYMVGYSWARQPAIRVQQKFARGFKALTLAMSLEQAQITNYTAANAPNNFFFNSTGQSGGLFNAFNGTPTNNLAPDVFVKGALDTPHTHLELGGVARFFRGRYYPAVASPATGIPASPGAAPVNDTKLAGGVFGSARVSPSPYVDFGMGLMAGDGVGRYGSAQLADATVHPDGRLEPVRNYHGLLSIETHPNPRLDFYAYVGGEYAQRTVYETGVTATPFTGYGPINANLTGCRTEQPVATAGSGGSITPVGACAAATRLILEGMAGWTYRLYDSRKFGRLQYQVNYQYLTRSAWTGVATGTYGGVNATFGSPKAVDNMVLTGFRYFLPLPDASR